MMIIHHNSNDYNPILRFRESCVYGNQQLGVQHHTLNPEVDEEHVCGSIDIRNDVSYFKILENCTVIEGFLQIVLIDKSSAKDYENITFPRLKEITDYFLLFRVSGLQSLAKMFPNLSVIRGRTLFHNYAFVIYQMPQLKEIGLKSLTKIVRGEIRIEKNYQLCFVNTVDWSRFHRNVYISGNQEQNSCPYCAENCPIVSARLNSTIKIGDGHNRICWTKDICQKHSCPSECESINRTCTSNNECCPEQCLGGCKINSLNRSNPICYSCKNFVYKNRCYESCPNDSYAYYNRRCLTKDECHQLPTSKRNPKHVYKAFMKKCDYKCPVGYAEDSNDPHSCLKCGDKCPKICESTEISNIAKAQSLKGCTTINGSLEIIISTQGSEIVKELEENLKDLVEIKGFLKIARSFPLISLNFLKNLRIIGGETLQLGNNSLIISDNSNLQDLWTFSHKNETLINGEKRIKILKGRIFVHMNPKLCYSKIENMLQYMEIPGPKFTDQEVSPHSNGDRMPCNVSNLDVRLEVDSDMIVLYIENFKTKIEDQRSLLGYLIYYRETNHRKVTIFDGRDACSDNEWTVVEYNRMDDANSLLLSNDSETRFYKLEIGNLKPYTLYALYVKTYTITTSGKSAQSDIIYFKTRPDTPSQPLNLFSKSNKPDEILVKWDPPAKPNGEITHYIVRATKEEFGVPRDSCSDKSQVIYKEPKIDHWSPPIISNSVNKSKLDSSKQCCDCQNEDVSKIRPNDVEQSINFEDYLLDAVFIKRSDPISDSEQESRRKRHTHFDNSTTDSLLNVLDQETITSLPETQSTEKIPEEIKWQFWKSVKGLEVVINDLEHFTLYRIEVTACQNESDSNLSNSKPMCSVTAMTSMWTLPLPGADDIENFEFAYDNSSSKTVHFRWKEPPRPNGAILSFEIEFNPTNDKTKFQLCIPYNENNNGYTHNFTSTGKYSVRLRARSLASYGNWTSPIEIHISEGPLGPWIYFLITSLFILLFIICFICLCYTKQKNSKNLRYMSVNPDYINTHQDYQFDADWEIPRDKITTIRPIGEGSFGKVFEGVFTKGDTHIKCAVKMLNQNPDVYSRSNFFKEATIMKSFTDCHHVVKLLGVSFKEEPFLVLMEMMSRGDLRNYLRNNRPDNQDNPDAHPPSLSQIYKMAIEIADGMAYLASKKFVHRDLASRNCMISEDLTVKIGDFGLARDIYGTDYYRKGDKGMLPVRWMSPESIYDGYFSTKSDVWAYGVVLWEIVTLGSQPYLGLSNEQVLQYVRDGHRMAKPDDCPEVLWQLMVLCWQKNPKSRPSFIDIIETLLEHIPNKASFLTVSYYNSSLYLEDQKNPQKDADDGKEDEASIPLKSHEQSEEEEIESLSSRENQEAPNDSAETCSKEKLNFFPSTGNVHYNGEKDEEAMNTDRKLAKNDSNNDVIDSSPNLKQRRKERNRLSNSYRMEILNDKSSTLTNNDQQNGSSYLESPEIEENLDFENPIQKSKTKKHDFSNVVVIPNNKNKIVNGHFIDTSMV